MKVGDNFMVQKYNNQIYKQYEKEVEKNKKLSSKYEKLRFEVEDLRYQNKILQKKVDEVDILIKKAVNNAVDKVTKVFEERIAILEENLERKDKEIDRLRNQVNKNSSNSSKPSSTDTISTKKESRTSANQYNYRKMSTKSSGGQLGHVGHCLSKKSIEKIIQNKNIEVNEFVHYISGNKNQDDIIKYKLGTKMKVYIEKHIFKHNQNSHDKLPKEFYTDVTYANSLKSLCIELGAYHVIPLSRVSDLLSVLTNNVINLSEGTVMNIYQEFSNKAKFSLINIENNLLNAKTMNTDETTSKQNGKLVYFRNYGNSTNALYKAHRNKGHEPIQKDNILTKYAGTIIGDHDTTLYKYGNANAECNIHTGRYLEELHQNEFDTYWQCEMKNFLLRLNNTKKLAIKYNLHSFEEEKIKEYEIEYDKILEKAIIENENIKSSYYRDKANTLIRRLRKYKENQLLFIKDFDVSFDNNAAERDLRMIKNKTKISGGFRSFNGAKIYADMMSIIKTSIKRKLNPFESIRCVFENKILFA